MHCGRPSGLKPRLMHACQNGQSLLETWSVLDRSWPSNWSTTRKAISSVSAERKDLCRTQLIFNILVWLTHMWPGREALRVFMSVLLFRSSIKLLLVYQAELLLLLTSLQRLMNVDWCHQLACNLKRWKFSDNLLTNRAFDPNPPRQPP